MMENSPRDHLYYPIDFNTQQAINALYMSELGDILNDKEIGFKYKRKYFSLKTRINSLMWNERDGIYYDFDRDENQIRVKTIAPFWTLLAEIPNEERANRLIQHLRNSETYGTENPFPTLAANEPQFRDKGVGFRGSVYPCFTFMVIKGLEKYARYEFARECAIRHLYYMLDTLNPETKEKGEKGSLYEAYLPAQGGPRAMAEEGGLSARPVPSLRGSVVDHAHDRERGRALHQPSAEDRRLDRADARDHGDRETFHSSET